MKPLVTISSSPILLKACWQTSVEQKQPLHMRRVYDRCPDRTLIPLRSARRGMKLLGPPLVVMMMMMMMMIVSKVASHASLSDPPGVLHQVLDDALKGLLVAQGVLSPAKPKVQRLPRLCRQHLQLLHVLS